MVAKYQPLPAAEAGHSKTSTIAEKACTPATLFILAFLISISQNQPSFGFGYAYHYDLKGVTHSGDGDTLQYSFWQVVQSLRSDGTMVLATSLLLWSGIFPFIKLFLVAFVDFLGKNRERSPGPKWRIVSFLSKLSFFDVWIVALTLLFVRIDIKKRQNIYLKGTLISRKLRVDAWAQAAALKGVYFFAGALVINQFLFHFVLQRAMYGNHPAMATLHAKAPLQLTPLLQRSSPSKFDPFITMLSIFSVVGLLMGLVLPFAHLDLDVHVELNKAGLVNEHIDMGVDETYSIITAMRLIGRGTHHVGRGNPILAAITFAFVVVAPLLQAACSSALWLCGMSPKGQRAFAGVIDVLSVVAAADCFGVVAFLMVWQLPIAFTTIKEATEYAILVIQPLAGLYIFTISGLMGTISSYWIHHVYMVTVQDEAQNAISADVEVGKAIGKAMIAHSSSESDSDNPPIKSDASIGIDDLESGLALGAAVQNGAQKTNMPAIEDRGDG